jgi:hypothetical protein
VEECTLMKSTLTLWNRVLIEELIVWSGNIPPLMQSEDSLLSSQESAKFFYLDSACICGVDVYLLQIKSIVAKLITLQIYR